MIMTSKKDEKNTPLEIIDPTKMQRDGMDRILKEKILK